MPDPRREILYVYKIAVKLPDGRIVYEDHKVLEKATLFGDAMASGRVVRYYERLKKAGKIEEYRIIAQ